MRRLTPPWFHTNVPPTGRVRSLVSLAGHLPRSWPSLWRAEAGGGDALSALRPYGVSGSLLRGSPCVSLHGLALPFSSTISHLSIHHFPSAPGGLSIGLLRGASSFNGCVCLLEALGWEPRPPCVLSARCRCAVPSPRCAASSFSCSLCCLDA